MSTSSMFGGHFHTLSSLMTENLEPLYVCSWKVKLNCEESTTFVSLICNDLFCRGIYLEYLVKFPHNNTHMSTLTVLTLNYIYIYIYIYIYMSNTTNINYFIIFL